RSVRRSPGFALAVALTLGIGVGVNGAIFGFVNGLLFKPVPARSPNELVGVFTIENPSGNYHQLGYDDLVDIRDRGNVFDGIAGFSGVPLNVVATAPSAGAPAPADMVWGEIVTENYFSVLAMRPAIGRLFAPTDAPQGANP